MFKRRWVAVLGGMSVVTLMACGRSTRNHDLESDPSMAGAGSEDDAGLSTHSTGGSSDAGPSAGGSGDSGASGGSDGGPESTASSGDVGTNGDFGTNGNSSAGGDSGIGGDSSTSGDSGIGGDSGTGGAGTGGVADSGSSDTGVCSWGTYDTELADDVLTCEPWTQCEEGFQAEFPDSTHDRVCEPCPDGTWNNVPGFSCSPFTKCGFGERVEVEPTVTNDRVCSDADAFSQRYAYYDATSGELAVTDQGVYLSVLDWNEGPMVWRYSPEGEDLGAWLTDEQQPRIGDLAHIGDQLFVSSTKDVRQAGVFTEPGFVKKFSADGELVWEHSFDDVPNDHYVWLHSAGDDDTLYTVAKVDEISCSVDDRGSIECPDTSSRTGKLVLGVLDTDGNELSFDTLEENTDIGNVYDVALAADGLLHAAVIRYVRHFADNCDEISEEADPNYYYYYCIVGAVESVASLLRIDGTELIGETVLEKNSYGFVGPLSADAAGTVYALTVNYATDEYGVYRVDGSGELLVKRSLAMEAYERIDAFTVTDSGLAFVGMGHGGALLLRTDADGQVISRDVPADIEPPAIFSAIQQAPDGRLFVAGDTWKSTSFAVPWPR